MESLKTASDVVKFCEERGVEMIHLWFVDILGQLKSVGITRRVLSDALEGGVGIDGSSVEGFARIYESDLVAMPDIDILTEMVEMMTSVRSYEANATALEAAKQMAQRALDI